MWDVTGRSVVITKKEDDLEGGDLQSKIDGNSGKRFDCWVICACLAIDKSFAIFNIK